MSASELSAGDRLLGHDGCWVPLAGIELSDTWSVVYNLRVAEAHTYFVGCDEWGFSVWAHNVYKDVLDAHGNVVKTAAEVQAEVATMFRRVGTSQRFADEMAAAYAAPGKPGNLLHAMLELEVATLPAPAALAGAKPTRSAMDAAAAVRDAEARLFSMVDQTKPGIDIMGEVLPDGGLDFMLRGVIKDTGERGTLSGNYMFERMMEHFAAQGTPIRTINGNWTYESNLGLFNRLTRVGLTPTEAAGGTITAEWAHRIGYTQVQEVVIHKGTVGNYSHVTAKYGRP
ncbi:YD repeat protein OS=Isosphaera pallida (strain ATCC 43644 / DSM 9630 / IS1B) GN=Isop_2419 PE=4 SV=1: PT-HINT [Tuwongella immobilis]|uniref:Intein C-terminal splicing domain-containing protein n=1 Tax=Tuwongella immobilis TaxID=692036 RepID=A0A6C2YI15_9BACT|nr:YD repeat protein OS=Isosphaera pallida (strain ATCC 43644 / DSM 9630 / IS1B) GN=Isop_2419 PE=4 SV=1: PT-HINT [Tuwongella immobilis]VTR97559.1 YD repeat protein OS=Isosphaera pallida (strain ATCC 43644 / DSM 9630 / IS1B) GN=Isop_2419 PE=4 SV=1: PT-HINT [Tuwongella immobilis]